MKQKKVFTYHVEEFGEGNITWLRTSALRCAFTSLGASIHSVKVWNPTRQKWIEVNCAYASYREAFEDTDYMGSTVGRYAGRIKGGSFTLDGQKMEVSRNMNNTHTLHGGADGFNKRRWTSTTVVTDERIGVRFSLLSPHLDQGFPAELQSSVYYFIEKSRPNVLHTEFSARITNNSPVDATVVNMFNHAYWNLNGVPEENTVLNTCWKQPEKIYNIHLKMPCGRVAEANSAAIPTGKLNSVEGTCLDFRKGKVLGEDISDFAQLQRDPCGYDHPLCVDAWDEKKKTALLLNAEAYSPSSNIQMKVYSTFPCIWLYTANNKPARVSGKRGQRYGRHTAVCLEPQYFPDSPNRPEFPSTIVRLSQPYNEKMVNEFNVMPNAHV